MVRLSPSLLLVMAIHATWSQSLTRPTSKSNYPSFSFSSLLRSSSPPSLPSTASSGFTRPARAGNMATSWPIPAKPIRGHFWSKRADGPTRGYFWSKRADEGSRGHFWSKRSLKNWSKSSEASGVLLSKLNLLKHLLKLSLIHI